jgi:hypothetical protein
MHSILRLDSEFFAGVPSPIAMAVPTKFNSYKSLRSERLRGQTIFAAGTDCLDGGIALSRMRDAFSLSVIPSEARDLTSAERLSPGAKIDRTMIC